MEFDLKSGQIDKQNSDCIIVPIFTSGTSSGFDKLNKSSNGMLADIVKKQNIIGEANKCSILYGIDNIKAKKILLVGCGKNEVTIKNYFAYCITAYEALENNNIKDAISMLPEIEVKDVSCAEKVRFMLRAFYEKAYKFEDFKSKKADKSSLKRISLLLPKKDSASASKAIDEARAANIGAYLTRDLGNTPANICTPTYLATEAKKLAKEYSKINTAILNRKDLEALKMGSFLSVTNGSTSLPKLISIEYKGGAKSHKPIVLVGKGITFDTGGNSLKPAASMIGMKYDMCGGATVFGVLKAVAELGIPLNVIGIVPACENMPGPDATRPDDIVTSMSGQTIEILNTDAEGRLILADALTYCERFKPKAVIDIATLTGACVVALGSHATGLMSNNNELTKELLTASNESYDRAWELPLWDEYHDSLKSPFADMANIGEGGAGTITAGCFLAKFAKAYPWAHLDIAGAGCHFVGSKKGATGRPVHMLVQYLLNQVK